MLVTHKKLRKIYIGYCALKTTYVLKSTVSGSEFQTLITLFEK